MWTPSLTLSCVLLVVMCVVPSFVAPAATTKTITSTSAVPEAPAASTSAATSAASTSASAPPSSNAPSSSSSATASKTTPKGSKTSIGPFFPITTMTPEELCESHNASCEECLKLTQCMYCKTDESCQLYPTGSVLPPSSMCALDKARWGVCWLNFEAMIISVSIIGGIIILVITCCCIRCCCCRGGNKTSVTRDEAKYEDQKMERKVKQDERRQERSGRMDEIRRKYGLMKEDS